MKHRLKLPWIFITVFVVVGQVTIPAPTGIADRGCLAAVLTGQRAHAAERYGIVGQTAPELGLNNWIDGSGEAMAPIRLSSYRGKVVYLYFFQDW